MGCVMRKFLSLGLVVAALAACAPNAPQNGPDQDGRLSLRQSSEIGRVGTYVAIARADAGLTIPLRHSPKLQGVAAARAVDLASDGLAPLSDRIAQAGYSACFSAEAVARDAADLRTGVDQMLADPAARAAILSASPSEFGFLRNGAEQILILARPC